MVSTEFPAEVAAVGDPQDPSYTDAGLPAVGGVRLYPVGREGAGAERAGHGRGHGGRVAALAGGSVHLYHRPGGSRGSGGDREGGRRSSGVR